jgi:flagellar motility protein MotE (MotC chaperone)
MTKLLTSTWATISIGVIIYIGATMFFWKTPVATVVRAEHSQPVAHLNGPSWNFINPEANQLIVELKEEKKAVEKREQELDELAVRLKSQRAELNQVTQAVYQAQMDFDKTVLRVKEEETTNLKKLAKVYSAMSPEGAANIFAEMDNETVVKIMLFMKEADTAAILENLGKKGATEAKRAVELSESLRVSVSRPPAIK